MRTSVVASMGSTFTHRDEMRATSGTRPTAPASRTPSRPNLRLVTRFLKRF
jgi:hypothetical protein